GSALVVAFRVPDTPIIGNTATAVTNTSVGTATKAGAGTPAATTAAGVPAASAQASTTATSGGSIGSTAIATPGLAATAPPEPNATPTQQTTSTGSAYADGTYAGSAIDEPWGEFQVQVTISGGEITDVSVVSEPSDGHSGRINSIAVPILNQAAIAAQSSTI